MTFIKTKINNKTQQSRTAKLTIALTAARKINKELMTQTRDIQKKLRELTEHLNLTKDEKSILSGDKPFYTKCCVSMNAYDHLGATL